MFNRSSFNLKTVQHAVSRAEKNVCWTVLVSQSRILKSRGSPQRTSILSRFNQLLLPLPELKISETVFEPA